MQDFRRLKVWQKSHDLACRLYRETHGFPSRETYGLTSQIRRAAVSIPANIAEGCGRGSDADFARFLQLAMGSASEIQYLLLLARDLTYVQPDTHAAHERSIVEIKRMLTTFMKSLRPGREPSHPLRKLTADS